MCKSTRHPPESNQGSTVPPPHKSRCESDGFYYADKSCGTLMVIMANAEERILKFLFILVWVLLLIHITAEYYYLYWTFRWLDIVTHFLGGVWVGVSAVWFWYYSGYVQKLSRAHILFVTVGTGFGIGVVWEVYEFIVKMLSGNVLPPNYIPDSVLDIVMDVVGAVVGYGIYVLFLKQRRD